MEGAAGCAHIRGRNEDQALNPVTFVGGTSEASGLKQRCRSGRLKTLRCFDKSWTSIAWPERPRGLAP